MLQLNCDLGECIHSTSMEDDEAIMAFIDEASVACGFHAGDAVTMEKTIAFAKAHGVSVGAHPAYPDRDGFGRHSMALNEHQIYCNVLYQLGAISAFCSAQGTALSYVKPHGALYHDVIAHKHVFHAILRAISDFDVHLPLVVLAQAEPDMWQQEADKFGIRLRFEAFADRAYESNGQLRARNKSGALLAEPEDALAQAMQIAQFGTVTAYTGETIRVHADTLCVHSDTPNALASVQLIRTEFNKLRGEERS